MRPPPGGAGPAGDRATISPASADQKIGARRSVRYCTSAGRHPGYETAITIGRERVAMFEMADQSLRRFRFPVPGHLGIGITACSERHATMLAEEVEIAKMGAPTLFGIWFPPLELGSS